MVSDRIYKCYDMPAAVRREVKVRALTTALVAPVFSSSTRVVAGSPRLSPDTDGTETIFIAVPMLVMRAGMKSARWDVISMVARCGMVARTW